MENPLRLLLLEGTYAFASMFRSVTPTRERDKPLAALFCVARGDLPCPSRFPGASWRGRSRLWLQPADPFSTALPQSASVTHRCRARVPCRHSNGRLAMCLGGLLAVWSGQVRMFPSCHPPCPLLLGTKLTWQLVWVSISFFHAGGGWYCGCLRREYFLIISGLPGLWAALPAGRKNQ